MSAARTMLPAASSKRSKNWRSLGTNTWLSRDIGCESYVKGQSSAHEVVRPAVGALELLAEFGELLRVDRVGVVVLGEAAGPNVLAELAHAVGHRVEQVGVALDEARSMALADAQQVVEHQHLAVGR